MFTGIITEMGLVKSRIGNKLSISAPKSAKELKIGDSISVNGVCLTATEIDKDNFKADLLTETIKRTNLGKLKNGDSVNLELPLKVGDRLGGHIVTGHIDCAGKLIHKYKRSNDIILEIEIPINFAKNIILKGSVAVNGIGLTVANILRNKFTFHIIPHTIKSTNLEQSKPGNLLNIETDKYFRART